RRPTQAAALCFADRLRLRTLGHGIGWLGLDGLSARRCLVRRQARGGRRAAGNVRDCDRQDARLPRSRFSWRSADARPAQHPAAVRVAEPVMNGLSFDIAHMLAGSLVLVSLLLLYQDRLLALINVFALHAVLLALSVAWQALIQDAHHLFITAGITLLFKAILIPYGLHRLVRRLGIHRDIEYVIGIGPTMLAGIGLVALSLVLMLQITAEATPLARQDLAFALSILLLGLLLMVTRRNAVGQVIGFMSME